MTGQFKRQTGLTLVELMVATTLSLVLLSGVLLVFSANKATYRMQTGLGTLQENGRYALRRISADLHTSGFSGCISTEAESVLEAKMIAISPPTFIRQYAAGQFFAGLNDIGGSTTFGGITMETGTDAIEIRGPLGTSLNYAANEILRNDPVVIVGTGTGIATDEYLVISDCKGADIFRATGVTEDIANNLTSISHSTARNVAPNLSTTFGVESVVAKLATHTYFVGNTGRSNAVGQQITALYRFDGANSQELVEGVEDLQIEYGEDTDFDFVADTFNNASGVGDWERVVSVRVSLLINSVESASEQEASYRFLPVSSTPIAPVTDDFRLRQEFTGTYSVRNTVL